MTSKFKEIIKRTLPPPVLKHLRLWIKKNIARKGQHSVSMSQAGQDHWVYGEAFNERKNGFFLDVGAHDGVSLSNTFILEKRYKWNGICIEANPKTFIALKASRDSKCINACIDKQSGSVRFVINAMIGGILSKDCDNHRVNNNEIIEINTVPLQQLLIQEKAPSVIDYLSIDIEGAEDRALLEFDFDAYRFNCITIERPSKQLRKLLMDKGYLIIKEIPGLDCFYIHADFKRDYFRNLLDFGNKKFHSKRWL